MSTIVIIGAGPGLGLSIAKQFGSHGFDVALIARNKEKLEGLVAELETAGVRALGYPADVTDAAGLVAAIDAAAAELGPIDVLEYSPAPTGGTRGRLAAVDAAHLTVDAVARQLEYYLFGGITAIQAVLPAMLARGSGTILVTTGASSGPMIYPPFASIAAASGALRNWILNLHAAVEPNGVYVAHIALAANIGKGGAASEADTIAESYWQLHQARADPELFYVDDSSFAQTSSGTE